MGFSEKLQVDGGAGLLESEGKKWVIAGIPIRAPLRKIKTRTKNVVEKQVVVVQREDEDEEEEEEEDGFSTTPTAEEARIPERLPCPPPPRKPRASSKCNHFNGGGVRREFFNPPDLESVFIRHVERAS